MAWNDTASIRTWFDLVVLVNTETNGLAMVLFLGSFFVICFMAMSLFAKEKVFLASSTITLLLSIGVWSLGLIAWQVVAVLLVFFLFSFMLAD